MLEKTKLEKYLKNGKILDKSYKRDLENLILTLKRHDDFIANPLLNEKDPNRYRIKLMLGPVKDFQRAYEKVDSDYSDKDYPRANHLKDVIRSTITVDNHITFQNI